MIFEGALTPGAQTNDSVPDHQAFLRALENNDGDTLQRLAPVLINSPVKMADHACTNVGAPLGSTYDAAVRAMFPDFSVEWL